VRNEVAHRRFIAAVELLGAIAILFVVLVDGISVKPVLLACIGFSIYKFVETIYSRKSSPFAVVFWLYHAFFLLIPGWMQVSNNFFPWARVASDADMESALCAVVLGMWSFSITYRLCGNSLKDSRSSARITPTRISVIKTILAILGTLPAVALIAVIGPSNLLQDRGEVGDLVYQSDALAMLYNAAKFSVFSTAIAVVAYALNNRFKSAEYRRKVRIPLLRLSSILCAAIAVFVNNPISSPRFHFLGMLLSVLLAFRPLVTRKARFIFWAITPLLLYTIFPVVKNISGAISSKNDVVPDISTYLMGGVDFDGLQQLANIARMTDAVGICWGTNFISAFLFWVPRVLWNAKATGTGAAAADYSGYEYSNLSAPLLGEALYGLGFAGVVIVFATLGWFASKCDTRYYRSVSLNLLVFDRLFVATVAGFLFILLRGALNSVFPQIGVALVMLIFLSPRVRRSL